MILLKKLEKNRNFWFLVFVTFFFFLFRLPSLFEPLWYGDEGIYQAIGISLNDGKFLYKDAFDNKPPLLYWLYAFLNSDQYLVRFASLIFGVLSIITFFFLSKKIFKDKKNISYLTTSVFAILFGLPLLEGNIANAENFMLLPVIVSAFFIVGQKKLFISGLILGIAFLFKIVAIFDFAAFFTFLLFVYFDLIKTRINKLKKLALGFFIPTALVSLFFLANGTIMNFLNAALVANIPYVSYGNRVGEFPYLLFFKLALVGIFVFYLFTKRKTVSNAALFVALWIVFSLFNAFFSQRPYTHYLLVLLPSFSLILGLILFEKKYQRIVLLSAIAILVIVATAFKVTNFKKNISYYQNFVSYMTGAKSTRDYQAFFDKNTPIDYEIALFIKPRLNKGETIFVWGNNAQLYNLVNAVPPSKYVVAYHITNYKDGAESTQKAIEKTKPRFVVIMPNQKAIPFPLINYSRKININNVAIYEKLF